jgi:hypothetical protein
MKHLLLVLVVDAVALCVASFVVGCAVAWFAWFARGHRKGGHA